MVEKWLQSKSKHNSIWKGSQAYYGKPNKLFKDSDKDGVMNVFDCKPFNKRKQDVMPPFNTGVQEMYARQEGARQQGIYERALRQQQAEQRAQQQKAEQAQRDYEEQVRNYNKEKQAYGDARNIYLKSNPEFAYLTLAKYRGDPVYKYLKEMFDTGEGAPPRTTVVKPVEPTYTQYTKPTVIQPKVVYTQPQQQSWLKNLAGWSATKVYNWFK